MNMRQLLIGMQTGRQTKLRIEKHAEKATLICHLSVQRAAASIPTRKHTNAPAPLVHLRVVVHIHTHTHTRREKLQHNDM